MKLEEYCKTCINKNSDLCGICPKLTKLYNYNIPYSYEQSVYDLRF